MHSIFKFGILLISLISATFISNAQLNARFGFKGGGSFLHGNWSQQSNYFSYSDNGLGAGLFGGMLLEFSGKSKSSKLKLQIEALYQYNTIVFEYNQVYFSNVNIPLSLKYFVKPNFSFNAGVAANINLGIRNYDNSVGYKRTISNYQLVQPGLHIGMSYYMVKGLFLDLRYNAVLTDMIDQNNNLMHGSLQFGIGYKFR